MMTDVLDLENEDRNIIKTIQNFENSIVYEEKRFFKNSFMKQKLCYCVTYVCCRYRKSNFNSNGCPCRVSYKEFYDGSPSIYIKSHDHECVNESGEFKIDGGMYFILILVF